MKALSMKRVLLLGTLVVFVLALAGCGSTGSTEEQSAAEDAPAKAEKVTSIPSEYSDVIDYLVLVNKENALPDKWEENLKVSKMTNAVGDEVETEVAAYEAYLKLKEALEKEDVHVDLDSAYRSVEAQEKIVKDFTKKYGEDYVKKYVAVPGYSEHHTGLALDLFLIVDDKIIYENEDMVKYPEVWEKIHAKLPEYGFILRYTKEKEDVTGYSYEPWHIRYVGSPDVAKEITSEGLALEEYLGQSK